MSCEFLHSNEDPDTVYWSGTSLGTRCEQSYEFRSEVCARPGFVGQIRAPFMFAQLGTRACSDFGHQHVERQRFDAKRRAIAHGELVARQPRHSGMTFVQPQATLALGIRHTVPSPARVCTQR